MEKAVRCWRTAAWNSCPGFSLPCKLRLGRNHRDSLRLGHHRRGRICGGVHRLPLPVHRALHAHLYGQPLDARQVLQRRRFQAQGAVRFRNGVPLHLQLLDTVAILDGAEVLPQIHHHKQEEHAQGDAERDHLASALRVGDLHHPRVVNALGEVDLRRSDEHAARLHCRCLLTPFNSLCHGRIKNSSCHHFLLAERPYELALVRLEPSKHTGRISGAPNLFTFLTAFSAASAPAGNPQVRSAARNFALRDRGLRSISSWSAVTGFLVSTRYTPLRAPSRKASFTMRSSSEWKLTTTSLPPGLSTRGAASVLSSPRRSSSSRFTRIRSAWKVRVAG